jgi:hypothetical protein
MAGSLQLLLEDAASIRDMCYEVYMSYRMIFRYLPRLMDIKLNVLNVFSLQCRCW